jgi:hypothetical protein
MFGKEKANRTFFLTLEWDHRDPFTKCRNASEILHKEERLEEIAKCDLLCMFCHHLKTHVNGDHIVWTGDGSRGQAGTLGQKTVTWAKFARCLDWKRMRLEATDDCCPGHGQPSEEGKSCPFQPGHRQFLEAVHGQV